MKMHLVFTLQLRKTFEMEQNVTKFAGCFYSKPFVLVRTITSTVSHMIICLLCASVNTW